MDFSKYSFVYNAEAHFKGVDRYPGGVIEAMQKDGTEGFNALCWALAEMSLQGELIRRDMGYEKGKTLSEDYLKRHIRLKELNTARETALNAIIRGLKGEDKEDEEVDEVLLELQKKNGKRLTKAQYLSLGYSIGMNKKDAMLSEISQVNEICEIRAEAQREARGKHGIGD